MIFELSQTKPLPFQLAPGSKVIKPPSRWRWTLKTAAGLAYATSAASYPDEKTARSNIADFRKAVGGVRFAKVVTAEATPATQGDPS